MLLENRLVKLLYKDKDVNYVPVGRCTGRTTGYALVMLGNILQNPGKEIKLTSDEDHGSQYDRFFFDKVVSLSHKLDLKLIIFNPMKLTAKYELYRKIGL